MNMSGGDGVEGDVFRYWWMTRMGGKGEIGEGETEGEDGVWERDGRVMFMG